MESECTYNQEKNMEFPMPMDAMDLCVGGWVDGGLHLAPIDGRRLPIWPSLREMIHHELEFFIRQLIPQ